MLRPLQKQFAIKMSHRLDLCHAWVIFWLRNTDRFICNINFDKVRQVDTGRFTVDTLTIRDARDNIDNRA